MTKPEIRIQPFRHSDVVIDSSFWFRHSGFRVSLGTIPSPRPRPRRGLSTKRGRTSRKEHLMRRALIATVLVTTLTTLGCQQWNDMWHKDKDAAKEERISMTALPEPVRNAFKKEY